MGFCVVKELIMKLIKLACHTLLFSTSPTPTTLWYIFLIETSIGFDEKPYVKIVSCVFHYLVASEKEKKKI